MNSPWKVCERVTVIQPAAKSAPLLVRYGVESSLHVQFCLLCPGRQAGSRTSTAVSAIDRLLREKLGNVLKGFEGATLTLAARQGLLGGLSNVIEVMRGEGAPPTAVRAVVAGALAYLDAELLNALVLRRDCCSLSAVKALQARACSHFQLSRPEMLRPIVARCQLYGCCGVWLHQGATVVIASSSSRALQWCHSTYCAQAVSSRHLDTLF